MSGDAGEPEQAQHVGQRPDPVGVVAEAPIGARAVRSPSRLLATPHAARVVAAVGHLEWLAARAACPASRKVRTIRRRRRARAVLTASLCSRRAQLARSRLAASETAADELQHVAEVALGLLSSWRLQIGLQGRGGRVGDQQGARRVDARCGTGSAARWARRTSAASSAAQVARCGHRPVDPGGEPGQPPAVIDKMITRPSRSTR